MNNKVRVRFAPSPTGPLHIGGIRTALYNYLFAKKNQGDFILRIEDTDSERFIPGAEEYIIKSFKWLGISFDEGPHCPGKYAPYRQSERKHIYKKYADQLLKNGLAYIAFDTFDELAFQRRITPNFQYNHITRMKMINSLTLSEGETKKRIQTGDRYVIRIKIDPNQTIIAKDLIRGEINTCSSILDDKILYKSSNNLPTYHLANIIDDHLMDITHVIRGEEWLSSTSLHVILYHYLGWDKTMPSFAHLPLLLKPEGKGKLSKRDGARFGFPILPLQWIENINSKCIFGYREEGYLPEALVNFLALLGWNPGNEQEILTMNQMISLFSLEKCNKSGVRFDYKKIKWFNHKFFQQKSDEEVVSLFLHFYPNKQISKNVEKFVKAIGIIKERIYLLKDIEKETYFFFSAPDTYNKYMIQKQWSKTISIQLEELIPILQTISNFSAFFTEKKIKQWITEKAYSLKNIMNALRLTIVGSAKGPRIFQIMEVIGKKETIARIKKAIQTLLQ